MKADPDLDNVFTKNTRMEDLQFSQIWVDVPVKTSTLDYLINICVLKESEMKVNRADKIDKISSEWHFPVDGFSWLLAGKHVTKMPAAILFVPTHIPNSLWCCQAENR